MEAITGAGFLCAHPFENCDLSAVAGHTGMK
jgi:hypothetical protein